MLEPESKAQRHTIAGLLVIWLEGHVEEVIFVIVLHAEDRLVLIEVMANFETQVTKDRMLPVVRPHLQTEVLVVTQAHSRRDVNAAS